MTSGMFHLVPIDSIVVDREVRQRRELPDIDILADSIRRLGLIHPLVITRNGALVTGERRLAAVTRLGWIAVPCQYVDELEPSHLQAIELEENVKRSDLPWQDQVEAIHRYHALRASGTEGWTHEQTATALGLVRSRVSDMLNVATEIHKGNQLVAEAPHLSTAEGIVRRAHERRDQQALASLHGRLPGTAATPLPESILNTDFNEWVYATDLQVRFNFIHCDFPYGIGADEFGQGSATAHGGYVDTQETWHHLIHSLDELTRRLTTETAHLMFWFSMRKGDKRLYEPTAEALSGIGWTVNPMPLIWMKSDGIGILPDPQRGPRQIYETCLLASKGDRKIVRATANAYHCPTVRDQHMSEKPEPMLRHFFGMLVDQNTVMLDPTCGSGSALRAAESLGAKYVLGLEVDAEFTERARGALRISRNLRKAMESTHDNQDRTE